MKRTSWIAAPLCASLALFVALHGTTVGAAGADDFTAEGVKLRGDGSIDDSQPGAVAASGDIVNGVKLRGDGTVDDSQPGAAPVFTAETVTNPDGSTTVIRVRTLEATGAAPARTRTVETTRDADGALMERTRSDLRTNVDGIAVREKVDSLQIIDGTAVRTRSDIRRNDAGDIIRSRERVQTVERPASTSGDRPARVERPDKVERVEKLERVEKADRPERVERVEKIERVERADRPDKVERIEKIERRERG